MADCGISELSYLHGLCDEQLKSEYKILNSILSIEEVSDSIINNYLVDFEIELCREISSRFVNLQL